jgi:hypothetical protein
VLECAAEGDFVCVFEVTADGKSAGQTSKSDAQWLEQADQIRRRRFTFDVGVGREDDLGY